MLHETIRFPKDVGATKTRRRRSLETRAKPEGSCPAYRGQLFFRVPLAAGASKGRRCRSKSQSDFWSSEETEAGTVPAADRDSSERRKGMGIPQRIVDPEKDCPRDPQEIRPGLPRWPRLENVALGRLELPSSRTACHPARRGGDCSLEALQVAGVKKKRKDWAPTWFSSMKAASCSSPPAVEPGVRKEKRPSFATATNMIASRRWQHSRFRHDASTWDCMSASSKKISRLSMWLPFFVSFYVTCADGSFCSGTKRKSTRDRSWRNSEPTTLVFTSNGSRATHQNWTLPNKYGTTSRATVPTGCPRQNSICASCSTTVAGACDVPRASCDRLFLHQTCHLHRGRRLHYLCETQ